MATFNNIVFNAVGSYTLAASSNGLTSATSNSFTIGPSTPSKIVFTTQPPNGVPSVALSPAVVVQVQDQFGNVATGSSASVTVGSIPAGASATVNARSGVAKFSTLVLIASNTYALLASSAGFANVVSNSFTIGTSGPSKVAFTGQPVNTVAGVALSPVVVQVQDAGGNLVSASNASITLTSNPAGVTATLAATNGVASFSNLFFSTAGSYTFTATSAGVTQATSNSFNVASAGSALPSVAIDSPAAGATISGGTVIVTGWALDNTTGVGTAIANVQ